MIIESLEILNFGPFSGKHSLNFSFNPKKPLIFFTGPGGCGRTAIINAIKWCLCEEKLSSFAKKHITTQGKEISEVQITIIENESNYKKRKTLTKGKINFSITKNKKNIPNPYDFLNKLFPQYVKDFMFIDGELAHTEEHLNSLLIKNWDNLNSLIFEANKETLPYEKKLEDLFFKIGLTDVKVQIDVSNKKILIINTQNNQDYRFHSGSGTIQLINLFITLETYSELCQINKFPIFLDSVTSCLAGAYTIYFYKYLSSLNLQASIFEHLHKTESKEVSAIENNINFRYYLNPKNQSFPKPYDKTWITINTGGD